jgi:hypothetical protein
MHHESICTLIDSNIYMMYSLLADIAR